MATLRERSPATGLRRAPGEWSAVVAWALFVAIVLAATAPLDSYTQFGPGPGLLPRALCVVLGVLVAVQVVLLYRSAKHDGAPTHREAVPQGLTDPPPARVGPELPTATGAGVLLRFALTMACLFGYAAVLEVLGFAVSTAALACAVLVLLGRPPLRALIEGIAATFLFRFVFASLLNVQLPRAGFEVLRSFGL